MQVTVLLQQRESHRAVRQFAHADRLQQGLARLGVTLQDTTKSWTVGPPPADAADPVRGVGAEPRPAAARAPRVWHAATSKAGAARLGLEVAEGCA